jgi:glycosyltransferase involved in cell wall biosynthesis
MKSTHPNEPLDIQLDHISVCICTYKRPGLLARTLDGVLSQATHDAFTLEVVIVDNDKLRSAQDLVHKYQKRGTRRILYDCEPEQNIALARNRAIHNAAGDLIAFIDDDEFPAENWLHRMYQCMQGSDADGVLGPVLPHFPPGAPVWLAKSGLCERPRNTTGSPIRGIDLRTGNILLRRYVFKKDEGWFDPALGLTGGSDGDYLWRQIQGGRRFVWCDEARVFETVPPERWSAEYYLKRNFRVGTGAGKVYRHTHKLNTVLISVLLLLSHSVLLPFSIFAGKHIWMRILIKIYYHAGCLLSFLGLTHVPHRQ